MLAGLHRAHQGVTGMSLRAKDSVGGQELQEISRGSGMHMVHVEEMLLLSQ